MLIQLLGYLIVSLAFNILLFTIAYRFQTDKLTDISYGLSFILLCILLLFNAEINASHIILVSLICIWAIRLSTFLLIRIFRLKKDIRFDGIREKKWSFLKFWLLQGFAVWVMMLPTLLYFNNNSNKLIYSGIVIWIIGFTIETVADYQKSIFKKYAKSDKEFISSGLWKYARYPNYFGEITVWVGIFIAVIEGLELFQMFIAVLSPLFIFILLRYLTGIPPLEINSMKKRKSNPEFQQYVEKTNLLLLWFPKK